MSKQESFNRRLIPFLDEMSALIESARDKPEELDNIRQLHALFHSIVDAAEAADQTEAAILGRQGDSSTAAVLFLGIYPSKANFRRWKELVGGIRTIIGTPAASGERPPIMIVSANRDIPSLQSTDVKSHRLVELMTDTEEALTRLSSRPYLGVMVHLGNLPASLTSLSNILDGVGKGAAPFDQLLPFLQKLRSNPTLNQLPVVAIADQVSILHRLELAQLGANRVMSGDTTAQEALSTFHELSGELHPDRGTLLILEDDDALREQLHKDLEESEFQVYSFPHFPDFARAWAAHAPAGIILGVSHHDFDTLNLCRSLKEQTLFTSTRVIFTTTSVEPSTRQAIFTAGADDYLLVPYFPRELLNRVNLHFEVKRLEQGSCVDEVCSVPMFIRKATSDMAMHHDTHHALHGAKAPLDTQSGAPGSPGEVATAGANTAIKVLVADDDRFTRDLLEFHLGKEGWLVRVAEDGENAEELLSKEKFSLVLLDAQMPFFSGFDVLSWVREKGIAGDTRFVLLSPQKQDDLALKAFSLGVDEFITKPFNPDVLVSRLRRYLPKVSA